MLEIDRILAVGWDRRIHLFSDTASLPTGFQRTIQYPQAKWYDDLVNGHQEDILSLAVSSTNLLATGDYAGQIIVWNMVSGHIFCRLKSSSQFMVKPRGQQNKQKWEGEDREEMGLEKGKQRSTEVEDEGEDWYGDIYRNNEFGSDEVKNNETYADKRIADSRSSRMSKSAWQSSNSTASSQNFQALPTPPIANTDSLLEPNCHMLNEISSSRTRPAGGRDAASSINHKEDCERKMEVRQRCRPHSVCQPGHLGSSAKNNKKSLESSIRGFSHSERTCCAVGRTKSARSRAAETRK
ncbi:unnamed protein product [Protopolystoma xenopodis]|uniref:Uncharacterized protein n=1 Tax=Protopolystoma xenopodis TaxID=117903 RepID=A0A448WWU2_9PLAT|nr:unnamed protein product [Protopolystoma xenopodis]